MITAIKPEGDKIMRLHAQTATIENGFVYLPQQAHWLADYLHELTVFPNGRHDDQVDSTAQAIAWTKLKPAGWAIREFYRLEHERRMGRLPPEMVRLKTPHGISHVVTMSGQQCCVIDSHVSVPKDDVAPLERAGYVRA